MANEFVAKNGLISQNDTTVSGSLTVTQGITGSLHGTSSWADNSITSSYILSSNVYGPNGFNSVNYASTADTAISINSPLGQNLAIHGFLDNFLNSTDFDSFIRTPNNFTGHYIGGTITDALPFIQPTELLYLESSNGWWYLVDQTTDTSTKMLGVCILDDSGIKMILLEGYVVLLETSINGDKEEGLPVFISGSGAYTTRQDFTSGYIRSVGYLHSSYFDLAETFWLLKFKPSNDWMRIA